MIGKQKPGKKLQKILALEICESSIVACEVQFVKDAVVLLNSFRLDIPVYEDVNRTIQYLKQTIKASHVKTKDCVIGLSMQSFKFSPVPIPAAIPLDEVEMIVSQEANVDQASEAFTWMSLHSTARQDEDGVSRTDVLGMSMKTRVLDSVLDIAQKSGLKAHVVTPALFGLRYFLLDQPGAGLRATLWISEIKSELVVWSGVDPIYEHLFLTLQLNDQVFQSINLIQSQLSGAQISHIFVCGPFVEGVTLSQLPNIASLPLTNNIIDKGNTFQRNSSLEIMTTIGLAVQGSEIKSDLLPNLITSATSRKSPFGGIFKEAAARTPLKGLNFNIPLKFKGKVLDPVLIKYALISIAVFFITFLSGIMIKSLLLPSVTGNQSNSESKVKVSEAKLTQVSTNQNINKVLNLKIDYFSELIEKRTPWSLILREIADMTPKTLWIDRLEVRSKRIDIFGRALNVDSVANFSINLNYTAKLVKRAQIIALRKFQEDDIDFIEFQVSVNVKDLNEDAQNEETAKVQDEESKISL